ncbi:MAG: hypothetical protein WC205_13150 [Opitutaceae bacterium]
MPSSNDMIFCGHSSRAGILSGLLLLGAGAFTEHVKAAIQVNDEQAVQLSLAPLPPGRGTGRASAESKPGLAARAFDGAPYTNWSAEMADDTPSWLEFKFDDNACWRVTEYSVTNGYNESREPRSWELQGSADGQTWVTLDTRKQQFFPGGRRAKSYRVRSSNAYNRYRVNFTSVADGTAIEVAEVDFTIQAPISPPVDVVARAEKGCVILNWAPVSGASGYSVRRAAVLAGPYAVVAKGLQSAAYTDVGPFELSETSYYTVTAELAEGEGPVSAYTPATTPLNAPTDLLAKPGNNSVVLEWTPVAKAIAYVVKRSLLPEGPYAKIGTLITSPAYTDGGLSSGTAYYYVICGVANGKEGADTAPLPVRFSPLAPTELEVTPGKEEIDLKWSTVALAKSYKVLRSTAADEPKKLVAMVDEGTTFIDKDVSFKKTYYYTIAAVNDCGASPESAEVSASPVRPPMWRRW